jgi:hypothetical protein
VKLDIGCGATPRAGFIGIDRKLGKEAFPLDLPDESVDEIYASHVLEHFGCRDTAPVLLEWVRVLKPGGRMRIAVPDLGQIISNSAAGKPGNYLGYLYGGQDDADDFHRSGFDEDLLETFLRKCGLSAVRRWEADQADCASQAISLNLEGYKPPLPDGIVDEPQEGPVPVSTVLPRIAAVMSCPRLAFTENMFAALQMAVGLGIPFERTTGVNWGQCLERVIEPHLLDGTEWILTLDYDTVFGIEQVLRLAQLMLEHPEIDALAPIQFKRDENSALFRPLMPDGSKPSEVSMALFEPATTRVEWCHFGLTLIRVSALRKLPKPWFWEQPSPRHDWGEGRIDNDIYFWKQCQALGLHVAIANHVAIGHCQQLVTWPDQEFRPIHQYVKEWQKSGAPANVRR